MRLRVIVVSMAVVWSAVVAVARTVRDEPVRRFFMPSAARRGVVALVDTESSGASWVRYQTQADLPNFSTGSLGNHAGVAANGVVTRDNFAVGFFLCCRAPKFEQKWTFTVYAPDANNNPTVLFQQAFAHQTTQLNQLGFPQPCWDGFFCGATSVDYFPFWTIDCTWKLGNYRSTIDYSFRATATDTLSTPAIIFERHWQLDHSRDAVKIIAPGIVHPGIEATTSGRSMTGYAGFPDFVGGSAPVRVQTFDCGVIPNVAFSITREFVVGSNSHGHVNGDPTPPNLDAVGKLDAMSGTTDASGNWSMVFRAGTIGGDLKFVAHATNFSGAPRDSQPAIVSVGFRTLLDPGIGLLDQGMIRYTGTTSPNGRNHPQNHFASGELHNMVRDAAVMYNIEAGLNQQGSLGLNDMSLPFGGLFDVCGTWTPQCDDGHFRHRLGTDVDVDSRVQRPDGSLARIDARLLTQIITQELEGFRVREGSGHLHFQLPEYAAAAVLVRSTQ